MVLKPASLIFNDSTSPFNKDLYEYLKLNLENVIFKCSIMFHFKIAKATELKELKDMGITRLPAMTIGKDHYIGVPNIVNELRNRIKLNTETAAIKSDDEILRDFQIASLGDVKKNSDGQFVINDNDDDDQDKNELMSAFNKEIARRTGNKSNSDNNLKPTRPAQEQNQPNHQQNIQNQQTTQQQYPTREDNVNEAIQSLKNIGKGSSSEDATDDTMMEALLERMGSD